MGQFALLRESEPFDISGHPLSDAGNSRQKLSNWDRCLHLFWVPIIHPFLCWFLIYLITIIRHPSIY